MLLFAFAALGAQAATVATVDGTGYETLEAAIKAVQNGETIVVKAGEYTLNGSLTYAGKAFTIQAAPNATVSFDMSKAVALHGAKITFSGVTFDYKTNGNYIGLQHTDTLVYNDCTVNGQVSLYAASETFNHCTFHQTSADSYNVWTYGAKAVTFNNCRFNCAGKSVLVYNEGTNPKTELAVSDCEFTASAQAAGKAAIEIDTSLMAGGATITIDGKTTAAGFAEGSNSKSQLWNDKKQTQDTNKNTTVTVAGKPVFAPNVAQVGEKGYTTLAAAFAALSAEKHTLTLLKDAAWNAATPVYWAAGAQSGYAATLTAALTAAYQANASAITIVCRPGADVGTMTHGHVADNLTIYGNNAYLSGGECDLEVDQYKYSRATGAQATDGAYLEKDITITAYELDNLGVWGERHTAHTVTVNLNDCDGKGTDFDGKGNPQRVYISGTTGLNNITLTGCDFLTKATAVYSNADGAITAVNCSFTGGQVPFNINHKANGRQTVAVENCKFTDCGYNGDAVQKQYAAPLRLVNSGTGTLSAEVKGCAFAGTVGANGDILLGDGRTGQASNDVALKVTDTAANIQAQKPGYYGGETVDATKKATAASPAKGTLETSVAQLLLVDENGNVTIPDEESLFWFARQVNEKGNTFAGKTVSLAADIALTAEWTPVGVSVEKSFKGTFDGENHKITGLNVSGSEYVGLIGVLDGGTVKNVQFDSVDVSGGTDAGSAVGRIVNDGTVENVKVLSGTVKGTKRVGGVVGSIKACGTVKNCENAAKVEASTYNVGGIVGAAYYTETGKEMYITNCQNTADITSAGVGAGGIVGLSCANVSGNTNTGAVKGQEVGGIVGEQKTYGSVTGNTNSGAVTNTGTGNYGAGGIIGWLRYHGTGENDAYQRSAIITVSGNSNNGTITGANDAGGIVGVVYNSAVITDNRNTAATLSGTTFAAGIVGNYQITETPAAVEPAKNKLIFTGNTSTLPLDNITAQNKDLLIYTNGNPIKEFIPVAQIGDQEYATLAEAVKAAKIGDTIKVIANDASLSVPEGWTISGSTLIPVDKTWHIANLDQLKEFQSAVNGGNTFDGQTVVLDADIGMASVENWQPIGNAPEKKFAGTFDGQNHTISGLKITGGSYVGLFGYLGAATVQNVALVGANVSGVKRVGALVGQIAGNATIKNCSLDATSSVTGSDSNTGGLIGEASGSIVVTLENLTNEAPVTNTENGTSRAAGILCQATSGASVTLKNCVNNGTITTNGGYAGGIVSAKQGGASLVFDGCSNTGTLANGTKGTGALLAWSCNGSSVTISNYSGDVANAIGWLSQDNYDHVFVINGVEHYIRVANGSSGYTFASRYEAARLMNKSYLQEIIGFFNYAKTVNANFEGYPATPVEVLKSAYSTSDGSIKGGLFNTDESSGWPQLLRQYNATSGKSLTAGDFAVTWGTRDVLFMVGDAVAKIGNSYYATLDAAVAAVQDGETITVLNYDADNMTAPDGWKFVTEEGVTTLELDVITISTVEELVAFSAAVNGGDTFAGKRVVLAADIDLAGVEWKPIGNVTSYPSGTFCGTFDGQNHVIANMTVSDTTPNYASAGLFGSICGTVKNVKLTNVSITSSHYAGGIVGYSSANGAVIENCHVDGGTIKSTPEKIGDEYDNGDKVGGIAGYLVSGDKVIDCSVKNLTVTAYRDVGGLVGCSSADLSGNKVEDTTVVQSDKNGYKDEVITTFGEVCGRTLGGSNTDATTSNVTLDGPIFISTKEELVTFAAAVNGGDTFAGKKVVLAADIDLGGAAWDPINAPAQHITFDGQGHKVSNFTVTGKKNVGFFGNVDQNAIKNWTIENATVSGINHVAALAGHGVCLTIENCHVRNSTITTAVENNDDGDKAGAIVGYLSGESIAYVKNSTVENCTVKGYRDIGGAVGMANGSAEVSAVTVKGTTVINDRRQNYKNYTTDAQFDVGMVVGEAHAAATIAPTVIATTTEVKVIDNVAQIGDTMYTSVAAALIAAQSGDTIQILAGTWGADAIGKLDEEGKYTNANIVRYKSLTIQPVEGAEVTFTSTLSLGYDDSSTANATMTVKNLNFDGASLALSNYVQVNVEGCTFKNGTSNTAGTLIVQDSCCKNHKTTGDYPASQVTIKNCTIDGSNDGASGIRIRNSGNVTITGNVIKNTAHNGILFESNGSVDNTRVKTVLITDNAITEWNVDNVADGGRAMRLDFGTLAAGSAVTIEDNVFRKAEMGLDKPDFMKITGAVVATVSLEDNDWNDELRSTVSGNSDYYTVDTATPVVLNAVVTTKKEPVAQIGETKYESLQAAFDAAKTGDTVTLLANTTLSDYVLDKSVTIRSAGETRYEIKGLKAIAGSGATLENVFLNLDQTLDIGGTDTTLKNCVMRAKDVGYWDIVDGKTTGFTGGEVYQGNAFTYLVRVSGTRVALTDCRIDGTDKDESYFPNMCLAPVSGRDVTMTRCTFNEGFAACYYSTPSGTWTLEDCTFTKIYCYNIQAGDTAAKIVVKGCSLAGWTSFGSSMAEVSFENCAFAKSSGYAKIVAYKNATFRGCTFTEDYKDNLCIEANTAVDLNGCSVVDGNGQPSATVSLPEIVALDDATAFAALDATKDADGKYTAGKFVASSTEVLRAHCAAGYEPVTNSDGTYGVKKVAHVVAIKLGGETKEMPFPITWLAAYIGPYESSWTTAALQQPAANGLAKWQCYLFGLDPKKEDAKVVATAGQGTDEAIPLAVANADASASPLVTGGYVTVAYVLMGSNDRSEWTQLATSNTRDGLVIPLKDKTYKFYRVDVTVTSAKGN